MDTSAKHIANVAARIFFWMLTTLGLAVVVASAALVWAHAAIAQEDNAPPDGLGVVPTDPHLIIMCQDSHNALYFLEGDSVVQRSDVITASGRRGIVAVLIDTEGKQHIISTADRHPDKCVWLYKDGPY